MGCKIAARPCEPRFGRSWRDTQLPSPTANPEQMSRCGWTSWTQSCPKRGGGPGVSPLSLSYRHSPSHLWPRPSTPRPMPAMVWSAKSCVCDPPSWSAARGITVSSFQPSNTPVPPARPLRALPPPRTLPWHCGQQHGRPTRPSASRCMSLRPSPLTPPQPRKSFPPCWPLQASPCRSPGLRGAKSRQLQICFMRSAPSPSCAAQW
mmetsp:Transcript_117147/g.203976  ORF Transcript_117147/g.203976 Transcript_117147/m.203976 type:complete len:206 (+) Transcript_117147:1495-2112(+)